MVGFLLGALITHHTDGHAGIRNMELAYPHPADVRTCTHARTHTHRRRKHIHMHVHTRTASARAASKAASGERAAACYLPAGAGRNLRPACAAGAWRTQPAIACGDQAPTRRAERARNRRAEAAPLRVPGQHPRVGPRPRPAGRDLTWLPSSAGASSANCARSAACPTR